MHAVIISGGKQYRVKEGDVLKLEKLEVEAGSTINFDQVLMVGEGENIKIGKPFLSGCVVKAAVVEHGRHDKIRILKFKRRKHHMKRMGHRQAYTQVKITAIQA
ncbi:MAG TPA: 50S ribosomal protein L21 [Gammaproteobacteria bacterium]|nr:50S ribosomal protein L21 [Gammaproteobacteria bacterium]